MWEIRLFVIYLDGFQFLGIPPKGEPFLLLGRLINSYLFPISRDPPEGGTPRVPEQDTGYTRSDKFPISRDPPEGGTYTVLFMS